MSSRPTSSSAPFASAAAILLLAAGCAAAAPSRPDLTQVEELVVEGTNRFRESESRTVLRTNPELQKAAREFAQYLARTGEFEHTAGVAIAREQRNGVDYYYSVQLFGRPLRVTLARGGCA